VLLTRHPALPGKMDYVLVFLALTFIAVSQILQKLAADNAGRQQPDKPFIYRIASSRETWWAIISLMTGTLFWLAVLYRMEVSKAFPYLSLNTVLVLLASRFFLHETIDATRWIGVMIIIIGIVLLSLS
jgi:undecaprenyl phosphate-alpha-L-ara4N flippase subunit ArnE